MRLLILGGTKFLGRHFVDAALRGQHEVTLFHRGQTGAGLYPECRHVLGDRATDLARLDGSWDAVLDTCGYLPRVVEVAARTLRDRVGRYAFISTISVYADSSRAGMNEDAAVGTLADPATEEITGESYGPLKALCEQVVREGYGARAWIVRPGLIVGPHDPTDRFTYWPVRYAQEGEVLAPQGEDYPVQVVDVRDLANFVLRGLECGHSGTHHATGPARALRLMEVLETCARVAGHTAGTRYLPGEFLVEHGVVPWTGLPLWLGSGEGDLGTVRMDCARALELGLVFRPLEETVRDTLAWWKDSGRPQLKTGLDPVREQELLSLYAAGLVS